jgi:hypothetical protein
MAVSAIAGRMPSARVWNALSLIRQPNSSAHPGFVEAHPARVAPDPCGVG